jgi:hypothetical protein
MTDTEVTAIVAAYQALLNARLGRRESVAWYLDSVLPFPVARIAVALQYAVMLKPEEFEADELGALYLELTRFIPHELAALPPRKLKRVIALRRERHQRELYALGGIQFGACRTVPVPLTGLSLFRSPWRAWTKLRLGRATPLPTSA